MTNAVTHAFVSALSDQAADIAAGKVLPSHWNAAHTLTLDDAAADGATKGIATFAAADFNASSGVISLDYTNAQAASAGAKGFLTAADWSTFNAKQAALTLGTGVQTALAVNVGSAGALVTFNGALGTPSSGTLTNATGLPEAGLSLANNTTADVSTSKHGFAPILPNDATKYLDGTGAYSVPAGSGYDHLSILTATEVAITTTATATISKQHVISGTSADYTVTLPAASGNGGKFIGLRVASNATKLFTIDGNASETIDGALTRVLWAGESAILYCDGSNWFKVAGRAMPMVASALLTNNVACANGVHTKINVSGAVTDNTGMMCDGVTNHRLNIKRSGFYTMFAGVQFINVGGASGGWYVELYINGAALVSGQAAALSSGEYPSPRVGVAASLTVGDYVELYAVNYFGTSTDANGNVLTASEVLAW